jgi:hypothetical protein
MDELFKKGKKNIPKNNDSKLLEKISENIDL